jgi:hypothetical protein
LALATSSTSSGSRSDVAADLDVALLQHVEQRHLDALGEVGQLVDREDAAVVRGTRPKWMVSGSPSVRPSATLIGSTSPMRSPTLVSGVASFSA